MSQGKRGKRVKSAPERGVHVGLLGRLTPQCRGGPKAKGEREGEKERGRDSLSPPEKEKMGS